MTQPPADDPLGRLRAALTTQGPLPPDVAADLVAKGQAFLEAGEYSNAAACFQRVVGFDDAELTAAAWLGLGEALYRIDRDADALAAWTNVTAMPETRSSYQAWLNVAGARVRAGDLRGATQAYREADRRAPAADRPMIASRLGWLAKESGDQGAARRYFARSRGDSMTGVAMAILGLTVVTSLVAQFQPGTGPEGVGDLWRFLALDKVGLANGELWRLLTVTLVHGGLLHLALNMYALYLIGPIVEGIWGPRLFLAFYVLTAAGASTASFLVSPVTSVGASGAIFGLIGVLLAGTRAHHPVLDARARAIVPQLGTLVIINLVLGFVAGFDNAAHLGGLISGLWLGLMIPPGRVPTLRSLWRRPDGTPLAAGSPMGVTLGVVALVAVIAVGLVVGGVRFPA